MPLAFTLPTAAQYLPVPYLGLIRVMGGSLPSAHRSPATLRVYLGVATNRVASNSNAKCDVFVDDRGTGLTSRVSLASRLNPDRLDEVDRALAFVLLLNAATD